MKKRFCDVDIWQKDWFLNLSDKQKLLLKFLYDSCDCAGIYEISWRMLRVFFTEAISKEDFAELKQIRFLDENTIFIEDFINFQYGISDFNKLNPNNNVHKGIIKSLKKYNLYEPLANPSPTPSQPLSNSCPTVQDMDMDMVKDKDKDKEKVNNISNTFNQEFRKKVFEEYREKQKIKEGFIESG